MLRISDVQLAAQRLIDFYSMYFFDPDHEPRSIVTPDEALSIAERCRLETSATPADLVNVLYESPIPCTSVEIQGPDGRVMYVNKSFINVAGTYKKMPAISICFEKQQTNGEESRSYKLLKVPDSTGLSDPELLILTSFRNALPGILNYARQCLRKREVTLFEMLENWVITTIPRTQRELNFELRELSDPDEIKKLIGSSAEADF